MIGVPPVKPALTDIGRVFLTLGLLGFGGPAAHIALMERELVARRHWLDRDQFLEMLAAVNLVPGPTSTELAFYIGYLLGGVPGAMLSGAGFIVPAVIASIGLAMIYVTSGDLPIVRGIFAGLLPVILALIASAAWGLARKAIDSTTMRILLIIALVAVAIDFPPLMHAFGLTPIYIPELVIMLSTGFAFFLSRRRTPPSLIVLPLIGGLPALFWRFLTIGATLFGSGYVIAAYLQRIFVEAGWMTPKQLIDVLAIGQATPGPVLSTASAAGYVMTAQRGDLWSGIPGALLATIGVFLPAFLIVLVLGRVVPYIRRYPAVGDFLKGVNAGVIALIAGAFLNLGWSTIAQSGAGIDGVALLLTIGAFAALERLHWSPFLLVLIGIAIGVALTLRH